MLAVFDAPARAVRCALAILRDMHQLGCEANAGLHTGEIELVGDDIAGIAVHIAARVLNCAGPGEVLVSRTIKDLVGGSGLQFEDRGTHTLRGVPDEWQLFAARGEDRTIVNPRTFAMAGRTRSSTSSKFRHVWPKGSSGRIAEVRSPVLGRHDEEHGEDDGAGHRDRGDRHRPPRRS